MILRELSITIVGKGDAHGELRVALGPEQFGGVLRLLESGQKRYEEELIRSVRTSLDSEEIVNPSITTDNKSRVAMFEFIWKNCVKKLDGKFLLRIRTADTSVKVLHGIGLLDILRITLPTDMVPTLVHPQPAEVSNNIIIWKRFNWNVGLKVEFGKPS